MSSTSTFLIVVQNLIREICSQKSSAIASPVTVSRFFSLIWFVPLSVASISTSNNHTQCHCFCEELTWICLHFCAPIWRRNNGSVEWVKTIYWAWNMHENVQIFELTANGSWNHLSFIWLNHYYLDNRRNSRANTCEKSQLLEGMYVLDQLIQLPALMMLSWEFLKCNKPNRKS